ncbi:uncharacterized protein HD556DRAFT_1312246 [Suillus plorans]|uniref:Uncharacterized protein n=1 Tax=Suillus plorans TaxID=116603 RepID=A0A9P7AF49_9AGAM|nr:uncharacterized protein HD556DRAFT_1312246 [Suillus plorans]KAG1788133.1 hypothetical protein HD556DRAFT_1312246 [Suillus plorans]
MFGLKHARGASESDNEDDDDMDDGVDETVNVRNPVSRMIDFDKMKPGSKKNYGCMVLREISKPSSNCASTSAAFSPYSNASINALLPFPVAFVFAIAIPVTVSRNQEVGKSLTPKLVTARDPRALNPGQVV